MSDSMEKAVWQAAEDGKEAELRRLIERGGSVNWHNPQVRRRMCLAWARSRPLLSPNTAPPRHNPTRFPTASSHGAPRRWLRRRPADTRSLAHASSTYGARRTPPCSRVVSSHIVGLDSPQHYCGDNYTALMMAAAYGHEGCVRLLLESKASVNATNVSLERALPQAHVPWTSCIVVIHWTSPQ